MTFLTEPVILSILGIINVAVGGIVAVSIAIVKRLEKRVHGVQTDVDAVKDNVVNHHTTNMRVENDDRHVENSQMLRSIRLAQMAGEERQLEHGEALDSLLTLGVENRRRIIALEQTEKIHEHYPETAESVARRERRYRSAYSPPDPKGNGNGGYVYRSRRDFRRANGGDT